MKNIIKLIILAVFLMSTHKCIPQVKLGIETGINFSNTTVNGDSKPNTGFYTAGILEIHLSKAFSFEIGLQYLQEGSKTDNGVVKVTHKQDFIMFPLIMKLSFPIVGKLKLFISGGGYYGISLSAKQIQSYHTGEQYEYDVSEFYPANDGGFTFGCGVSYRFGKVIELTLELRRALGTSNITEIPMINGNNTGTLLITGIKFRL